LKIAESKQSIEDDFDDTVSEFNDSMSTIAADEEPPTLDDADQINSSLTEDSLSLYQTQLELQKLKESTSLTIQKLREELETVSTKEQTASKELEELKGKYETEQIQHQQFQNETQLKLNQAASESSKYQFEILQLKLEVSL
jgi:hypothetical protein